MMLLKCLLYSQSNYLTLQYPLDTLYALTQEQVTGDIPSMTIIGVMPIIIGNYQAT